MKKHQMDISEIDEHGGVDCTLGVTRLDTLRRQNWTPVKTAKEDSIRKRKVLIDEA